MQLTSYDQYQDFLQDAFNERQRRNERYSLRAFAKSLGLSPAMLTGVLNRRKGLSLQSALQIAEKLNLSDIDSSYFCDLVVSTHSRSKAERKLSMQRASIMRRINTARVRDRDGAFELLDDDELEFLKNWYYLPIVDYVKLRKNVPDLAALAADLDLSVHVAREAVARLLKLGLLKKVDGVVSCTGKEFTTSTDIPSSAIRSLHTQYLELAKKALHTQTVNERDNSFCIVPTSKSKIAECKQRLQNFRRELMAFLQDTPKPDALYCTNIQFFSLLHSKSEVNEEC